jgi:hypothetical protein
MENWDSGIDAIQTPKLSRDCHRLTLASGDSPSN